ncbi:MAG: hypothetical protein HPM95_07410 [Alphaproteobacteria bacterium]|nr:hypothetical protein [Alphaproteobacteria bacterium]
MLTLDARPSTSNGLAQDIISSETGAAGPAAVLVPDAHLLFSGTYARAGFDLVISGEDGSGHVIAGYFAHVTPPACTPRWSAADGGDRRRPRRTARARPICPARPDRRCRPDRQRLDGGRQRHGPARERNERAAGAGHPGLPGRCR